MEIHNFFDCMIPEPNILRPSYRNINSCIEYILKNHLISETDIIPWYILDPIELPLIYN